MIKKFKDFITESLEFESGTRINNNAWDSIDFSDKIKELELKARLKEQAKQRYYFETYPELFNLIKNIKESVIIDPITFNVEYRFTFAKLVKDMGYNVLTYVVSNETGKPIHVLIKLENSLYLDATGFIEANSLIPAYNGECYLKDSNEDDLLIACASEENELASQEKDELDRIFTIASLKDVKVINTSINKPIDIDLIENVACGYKWNIECPDEIELSSVKALGPVLTGGEQLKRYTLIGKEAGSYYIILSYSNGYSEIDERIYNIVVII